MADEAQYSSGTETTPPLKPKYEDQPSGIELAKQSAQEVAARLLSGAPPPPVDAKRPTSDSKPQYSAVPPISYRHQGTSKKIDIPNGRVGVILGKGGETIKFLQLQSGAKIQVTRDMDADPNSQTRMVELMGTPEAVASAEKLINEVLAEAESGGSGIVARTLTGQAGSDEFVMKIPNNKVGLIIGKGGETIKNMQASTGARIQMIPLHLPPGDTSTERTFQIDGTPEQIESAKQLINQVISGEALDGAHFLATGELVSLGKQQLVDCDHEAFETADKRQDMAERSKELLQFEHKGMLLSSLESALRVCDNKRESDTQTWRLPSHGSPLTALLPPSQLLGKVKDFLGVMSEANKRLELDAKDHPENYDIEELTGNESEVIEMDLMLGVADLKTPEAVAAAESATSTCQPVIPLAADDSETDSEDSSADDDSGDDEIESSDDYCNDGNNGEKPLSLVQESISGSRGTERVTERVLSTSKMEAMVGLAARFS